ncbi:MAG: tRNA (adenosine(37)-N6)-dimethylallyltransferase MiaA [Clostridia bacterium]|nr:tRNA (adenosine(37)-N6)-dimethylallyltransferase MiaA [Clostridia bacterium]
MSRVVFVVGPTASGKSDLAVKLAHKFSSPVISADSMQIYRGMHIASAAPDESEMQGVEHKLLEFLPYGTQFSVSDYADMARGEIKKSISAGKTPIVAGGTGLYINALTDNVQFLPVKTDYLVRERLDSEFERLGGEAMLERLRKIDYTAAEKLSVNDRRRIIRALEIYETSGITKTEQNRRSKLSPPEFTPIIIGINFADRQKLYDRINKRVDTMVQRGLVEEAKIAFKRENGGGAVQAIGHKEFFGYFKGEQTLEEAIEGLKRATRRYAKRQLTWFNKDSRINWILKDKNPDIFGEALKIIEREG